MQSPRAYIENGKVSFVPALPRVMCIVMATHVTFYAGAEGCSRRLDMDLGHGHTYSCETYGNRVIFPNPLVFTTANVPTATVSGALSADIAVAHLPSSAFFASAELIDDMIHLYPPNQDEECVAYYRRLVDVSNVAPDPQEVAIALLEHGYVRKQSADGGSLFVWRKA